MDTEDHKKKSQGGLQQVRKEQRDKELGEIREKSTG
jgi:hypothetical protein